MMEMVLERWNQRRSCTQPLGYSSSSDDCDDNRFETRPNVLNSVMKSMTLDGNTVKMQRCYRLL